MRKALVIICMAIAVAGTTLYIIKQKEAKERQILQQNLITTIEDKRSGNDVIDIDLKQINSFAWNNVYIFTPYMDEDSINKQLGFKWSKADLVAYSDSYSLVVFVKGKKVVRYVLLPRRYGDFMIEHKNEFKPSETLKIKPLNFGNGEQ
ncbi:hypothetical protein SAMN05216378_2330 [Paenibacillus catalpae]|uniref:Uncharacterized protein n=1 Tax=Paenibacillus catalpae TaxID=1045775 RepID=A0A1I1XSN7_9BACL|nr:hypothetical protein [Paenibacillus catalpae]SFE10355.1 hypothetical protein SAMN05216378_2330 [Paenibacillus catalpae]